MKKLFAMLAAVSLSTSALAGDAPKPAAAANHEGGTAPLMVSLTDLKWTELPERKGMQFAVLSGDPKKGAYTQMRRVPAGTSNPLHTHSSELKNVIISGVWYTGTDATSACQPTGCTSADVAPEASASSTRRAKRSSTSSQRPSHPTRGSVRPTGWIFI